MADSSKPSEVIDNSAEIKLLDSIDLESFQQALIGIMEISQNLVNDGSKVTHGIEKSLGKIPDGVPLSGIYDAYKIKEAICTAGNIPYSGAKEIPALRQLIELIDRIKQKGNSDMKGIVAVELTQAIEGSWRPLLDTIKQEYLNVLTAQKSILGFMVRAGQLDLIESISQNIEALKTRLGQAETSLLGTALDEYKSRRAPLIEGVVAQVQNIIDTSAKEGALREQASKDENERLKTRVEKLEKELSQTNQNLSEEQEKNRNLQDEVQTEKSEKEMALKKNERFAGQIADAQRENTTLQGKINELESYASYVLTVGRLGKPLSLEEWYTRQRKQR